MVQVHYGEGVANRTDPESCAPYREVCGEALTGERAGQLSRGTQIAEKCTVRPRNCIQIAEFRACLYSNRGQTGWERTPHRTSHSAWCARGMTRDASEGRGAKRG